MSDIPTLMPPSATPLMRALDLAIRLEIHAVPHVLRWLYDPACCPAEALPHLAWAWSVDVWNDAWPEEIKRRVIANSLAVHRVKGSVGSVRRAIASVAVGVTSELIEWHEMQGALPHTFTAVLIPTPDALLKPTGVLIHNDLIDEIKRMIDASKPLRSHYQVRARIPMRMPLGIAAGMACRMEICAQGAVALPLYAAHQPLGIALGAAAQGRITSFAAPSLPRYAARKAFRITAGMRMGQKIVMRMTPEAT